MKIATNRKAYYEYYVLENFEAGIVLMGSEVKSIRRNNVSIHDSFACVSNGEVWLKNMKVARYKQAHPAEEFNENRDKKLLLNKKEIRRIEKLLQNNGTTIVPLEIYTANNRIKIKIGVVKGKKLWNKKESIKERDVDRDTEYQLNRRF